MRMTDFSKPENRVRKPKKKAPKRRKKSIKVELDEEQKLIIIQELERDTDLMRITRILFGNTSVDGQPIDGRSKEGRAVRQFIASKDKKVKTTKFTKVPIVLTTEQESYLLSENVEKGMTVLEITKIIFKNKDLTPFSPEYKVVKDFIDEHRQDIADDELTLADSKYVPPKSFLKIMRKVNLYCSKNFDVITIHAKQRKWVEGLQSHLRSPLFISSINQLKTVADRELFEGEFVRATWDKPDLTSSEINNYVMVCTNYIRIKQIQSRMNVLNGYLDDSNETQITMKLTELIKSTSAELDQCEKRVSQVLGKLEVERAKRIEKKGQENGSILALVEAFQLEEERNRMVEMAEMKNKLVSDEVDRMEGLDEFKARIMGISKEELL